MTLTRCPDGHITEDPTSDRCPHCVRSQPCDQPLEEITADGRRKPKKGART